MKLRDIGNMEYYLENRCYCPHEIYDFTGLFYELFYPDDECELLGGGEVGWVDGKFVIVDKTDNHPVEILYIGMTGDNIDRCIRIAATKNNIEQIKLYMRGKIQKMSLDDELDDKLEVLKYADAIMIT